MTPILMLAAAVSFSSPAEPAAAPKAKPRVALETSQGKIVLELDPDKAPITTQNFLNYVGSGHYNGTIFHRVIPGFMIQGGGFTADMTQKETRSPIKNESSNGLKNDRGTISMARLPGPDTASAQFFINLVNNNSLNHPNANGSGYAVFGKVVEGMSVVDAIAKVPTGSKGGHQNVPTQAVTITKAVVQ
jgi:peptidyl-prolyl cis-trans isomerase A (cyclophilin A)